SVALTWIDTTPLTFAPLTGEVMLITGGVVSAVVLITGAGNDTGDGFSPPAPSLAGPGGAPLPPPPGFPAEIVGASPPPPPLPPPLARPVVPPILGVAETCNKIPPDTVAPAAGELMLTVGGVVSRIELLTVTVICVLAVLPAASLAVAVRVCDPFATPVVFQE